MLGAGLAGAGLLAMPAVLRAQDKSLKVGVYGGYFKDSFDKNIFPEFTKATGIAVESVAEPTGEAWLVQLEQAAKAGQAPADLSMMSQTSTLKGQSTELWTPIDTSKIKHYGDLLDRFVNKYPDGRVAGIGAVAWYITLVTNTKVYPTAPDLLGGPLGPGQRRQARPAGAGLQLVPAGSYRQDLSWAAPMRSTPRKASYKAFEKLAEVKPNVRLWYRDEAQFEQALKSGEIPMGQYYHDVTGLAAADGHPVRSTFPKEGGIQDSGNWVLSRASTKVDEAHVFIDYMSQPAHAGPDVAQGRHGADAEEGGARPDAGGIRSRFLRDRADHPALRPLYVEGRLDEPEVDRADRRVSGCESALACRSRAQG